jgi:cbb3-type cytochrome c oxidase subunit III
MTHALRATLVAAGIAGLLALPLFAAISPPPPPAGPPKLTPRQERGAHAFLTYCALCHGNGGAGDGPLADELRRRTGAAPVHLDDTSRVVRLGRAGLRRVVMLGGAHTGRSNLMPAWGERLKPQVIDDIVEYLVALPGQNPAIPAATVRKYLSAPPGSAAEGRQHFVHFCSACHGPQGHGDGLSADSLYARNKIRPRNLTDSSYFAKRTDEQLYATISLGGGHMGKSPYMPGWTYRLSPRQIKDLISYVRAISRTPPRP